MPNVNALIQGGPFFQSRENPAMWVVLEVSLEDGKLVKSCFYQKFSLFLTITLLELLSAFFSGISVGSQK